MIRWENYCSRSGKILASYITHFRHSVICKLYNHGVLNWRETIYVDNILR